jgi:hypothetical protein
LSRPAKPGFILQGRERLRQDSARAALLRELYPQLAELRIEIQFEDGTTRAPSAQTYSYFPAARGFFRFPCPCHSCDGEFDVSGPVAELAGAGRARRSGELQVSCKGQRMQVANTREACPICARIRVSTVLHPREFAE